MNQTARLFVLLVALAAVVGGCAVEGDRKLAADGQRDRGLVIILPGIQGNSPINEHIRAGLVGAGIECAVEIRQWGFLLPVAKLAVNQVNVPGNRAAGKKIAEQIAAYQQQYPGRVVYLVGHSGGAGIAVFALESLGKMPGSRQVTGAALLSASISGNYDLTAALRQSQEGIVNFHNDKDVALLGIGTTILGNVDGGRAASAGRAGFQLPPAGAGDEKLAAYKRLFQVRITRDMIDDASAPHVASTSRPFVAAYVAEWIMDRGWPPPRQLARLP